MFKLGVDMAVRYVGPKRKKDKRRIPWCIIFEMYLFQDLHNWVDSDENDLANGWIKKCGRCGKLRSKFE